jgi:hypothetical protein
LIVTVGAATGADRLPEVLDRNAPAALDAASGGG